MIKKNAEKNAEIFYCPKCDFLCSKLSDWNRHITRRKHLNDKNDNKNDNRKTPTNVTPKYVCECGKVYKHQSGLSRHKKTPSCKKTPMITELDDNEHKICESEIKLLTDMVIEVIKQTNKQNQELTNKIAEICKSVPANNTLINNTNNNTFNLNVFLK